MKMRAMDNWPLAATRLQVNNADDTMNNYNNVCHVDGTNTPYSMVVQGTGGTLNWGNNCIYGYTAGHPVVDYDEADVLTLGKNLVDAAHGIDENYNPGAQPERRWDHRPRRSSNRQKRRSLFTQPNYRCCAGPIHQDYKRWDCSESMKKPLLIVGSARCVWDDLKQFGFPDNYPDVAIMAVNDMIMHFPGDIDHIFSAHGDMLINWWKARRPDLKIQFKKRPSFHSVNIYKDIKGVKTIDWSGQGTSGLGACFTGLDIGYDEIVLAGIPIDNSGHYWEPEGARTNFQREIVDAKGNIRGDGRRFWANAKDKFDGRVKSLSGFTKLLLGSP